MDERIVKPRAIIIDDEFRGIIPPLTDEELRLLEESINQEGCRDPLVVWKETNILLDGHNRHRICQSIGAEFSVVELSFPDRSAATQWIIKNQLGRRNLTNFQRCELVAHLKPAIEAKAKERQEYHGGTAPGRASLPQISVEVIEPVDTQKEMAKLAGVSHDTWARYEAIKDKITDEAKQALRAGASETI